VPCTSSPLRYAPALPLESAVRSSAPATRSGLVISKRPLCSSGKCEIVRQADPDVARSRSGSSRSDSEIVVIGSAWVLGRVPDGGYPYLERTTALERTGAGDRRCGVGNPLIVVTEFAS
jgi:hypothetical protein